MKQRGVMRLLLVVCAMAFTRMAWGEPCTGSSSPVDCRSLEIDLLGRHGGAPRLGDYDVIRTVIGSLVGDLKIKKYLLRERPAAGGFKMCLEPTEGDGYDYIVDRLSLIRISDETIWDIRFVENCGPT